MWLELSYLVFFFLTNELEFLNLIVITYILLWAGVYGHINIVNISTVKQGYFYLILKCRQ